MVEIEKALAERLGTRVIIETHAEGGRLLIDFFSPDDLTHLADALKAPAKESIAEGLESPAVALPAEDENGEVMTTDPVPPPAPEETADDDLYAVSNFTV
jgi:hypothetical protein